MTDAELEELLETLNRRVGVETAPVVTEVDRSMIRRFAVAIGDDDPLYVDEAYARSTRFGGIVAPPTFVAAFVEGHFPEIVVQDLPFARMLHSEDVVTLDRLIRPGDVVTARARYAQAWASRTQRGPRVYQGADLILTDAEQERIANVRIVTISF